MQFTKLLCALCAIALANSSHAAPAKPAVAAKSQIDARGVAALDKSIAYYKKSKSFSFTATELMYLDGEPPRRTRFEVSLQAPYRASLNATVLDERGKEVRQAASHLINNEFYYVSELGRDASSQFIGSDMSARRKAIVQLFRILPSAGVSIVSLALGENPARQELLSEVRYGEARDGARALKTVTLILTQPTKVSIELGLSPQNFALERVVLRGNSGGKKLTTIVRFSDLNPNWKGSQVATDAAVYNWQSLAPEIALAPPNPEDLFVDVDPKVRATFARATQLYHALEGLRIGWNLTTEDPEMIANNSSKVSLDFDRVGRLRMADSGANDSLIIINGKDEWYLDDSRMDSEKILYRHQIAEVKNYTAKVVERISLNSYLTTPLASWLEGVNPFDSQYLSSQFGNEDWMRLNAQMIAPAPFDGETADRARIVTISALSGTIEQIYWFARSNGRLMRLQFRSRQDNVDVVSHDWTITAQTLNPKFAPDTFKFTPPKGAVLAKD